ncbi:MAG: RNA methyltransferase [Nitrososphaerota archaeon]|nr:RNA methyltransferase [Nitrososphaerota archaeon]
MCGGKLCIALPASLVSDIPHLREKTSRIGLIGRTAAIFGVDDVTIYMDEPEINQEADANLIALLLSYMETPQYLRKKLFRLRPELRYAGILPPLRTPHHPLKNRVADLKVGEYREGVTVAKVDGGTLVDIGVEKPALIKGAQLPIKKRVTVKITSVDKLVVADLAKSQEIPCYWGYKVRVWKDTFGRFVKDVPFDLKIATSKYGVPFADVRGEIAKRWKRAKAVLVAFGAPTQGLYEIAKRESLNLDEIVDFVVNTIPEQKTETVRTEEALLATLAIFNCCLNL